MDEARRKGIQINTRKLEQKLGIPVIATTARYGDGIQEILEAIEQIVIGDWKPSNKVDVTIPQELESSLRSIEKDLIDLYPTLPNTRWIALRLLESDEHVIEALKNDEFESLVQSYSQTPLDLQKELEEINRLGEE
jgi:ferrous iron transport protein B